MQVGFIGLGTMGGHMARHVIEAGHRVAVHDQRPEAAEAHLAAGAVWAGSPAEAAAEAEVVFTSLPGPPEVESVAAGLLEGMRAGSAWFDLTTNSPTLIRALHRSFAAHDVAVLDAPVSGGPHGAASGRLALWVGGDPDVYQRHEPLLRAIGDQPYYVGPIGAGAIAKLVHNCAGYTIQAALAEVFTMGVKAGVDPLVIWQAVRQGAIGRQRTFERLADHFLPAEFDPPSFALRLAHKDMSLAVGLGREHNVPMHLAGLALDELTEALNRGWGGRDSRAAMLLQEERAGVEIRVPKERIAQARAGDA
ncbi:MAG: NAD(P)-dependent oxidoreductase [Acidimicrobiales bacterium]